MSIKGRFTGHFLTRAFALFAVLGLLFAVWLAVLALGIVGVAGPGTPTGESPVQIMERLESETTVSPTGEVVVGVGALEAVDENRGWLQVLDAEGYEIFGHRVPDEIPGHYTPGQLVHVRQAPGRVGQAGIHTWYSAETDLTWVLGTESGWSTPLTDRVTLNQAIGVLGIASLAVALLVAWASSGTLARPVGHMMAWLGNLAGGEYAEPRDRYGRPMSRAPDSRRRRPYRTYREVFDALDKLTAELARTEAERERLESAREEWIAGISHDLKTPLSSVRGYADLLASDYTFEAAEVREHAALIGEQADHMEALIGDLLLTYRLRAEALPLHLERVDAVELVREAVVDLANDPRAADRTVRFEEPPGSGPVTVSVDARWFRRALTNLLVNCAVHNPPGTTVRATVLRSVDTVEITVGDDGRGMDAETVSRLFDRYFRGTSTDADAVGTGLGMAIARQLVESMGGTLTVRSAPGQGTVFTITLGSAASSS
ncbi:MAG: HAMP domain-containing sensor histidine kinase [Anaerosomatales bacterium]|nr:HAMP domain-containing sensor histidine kinase [Anaerosomatales bacterium]